MAYIYTDRMANINTGFSAVDGGGSGGGGSPVLLDGLMGWSLTGGPEQTLDDTGVISSGIYDWTENGAPISYGSNGAHLSSTAKKLTQTPFPYVPTGNQTTYFEMMFDTLPVDTGPTTIHDSGFYAVSGTGIFGYFICPLSQDCIAAEDAGATIEAATTYHVFCWRGAGSIWIQVNGRSPVSTPDNGIEIDEFVSPSAQVGGFSFAGYVKNFRYWTRALSESDRIWLYNSGNGRSDAEVAAYTG